MRAKQLEKSVATRTAASKRRSAKSRETELDPKPPVKPVRVAAPSKPKKPKYSGNHAPSCAKMINNLAS
jgi:hypothetical protein